VKVTSSSSSPMVGGPVQPRRSATENFEMAPASIRVRAPSHFSQIRFDHPKAEARPQYRHRGG
jgi:hypothetical protein